VLINRGFYLCVTEVTQAQWQTIMGDNPSYFKSGLHGVTQDTSNHPVELISWDKAQEFINKLNSKGIGTFRLPSEAEWEYACRAGSTSRFIYGEEFPQLDEYGWYQHNSDNQTHPVGELKPNRWGLYDLYGNVSEWCADDWHDDYNGAPNDGSAWVSSPREKFRVIRGGNWNLREFYLRSACRGVTIWTSGSYHGLRIVKEAK
jgi:formylglycine-generating enzyme required for sulfatase activity